MGSISGGYYLNHPGCGPGQPGIRRAKKRPRVCPAMNLKPNLPYCMCGYPLLSEKRLVTRAY